MKKTDYTRKIITGFILFIIAVGLQMIARNSTGFANWYTGTIYPLWVNTVGKWLGKVSFSVAEILLYCLAARIIFGALIGFDRYLKWKKSLGELLLGGCGNIISLVGGLFFIYTITCGINYHRDTFSEMSGLNLQKYNVEQLNAYCEKLTDEVNVLSQKVNHEKWEIDGTEAVRAMRNIGKQYDVLDGYYPIPKPVKISEILSYQHLTGVYSPFTIEANYNADMADYNIPFTMCHELSHLRGFMREDEANYIAYLACSQSENAEFQYSGALMAWLYSTNLLYDYDLEAYAKLDAKLTGKAKEDLKENSQFWERYEGQVSELSNQVNDTYLKANKQTDGVESYDRMVDLLMAEYLKVQK